MTFYPLPFDVEKGAQAIKLLPEICVLHRFFLRGFPAVFFPLVNPGSDAGLDVIGIRCDPQGARPFDGFERFNDGSEFHAVVGSMRFCAAEHFFMPAITHEYTPTADAWIAFAGAIGIDVDDIFSSVWQFSAPSGFFSGQRVSRHPMRYALAGKRGSR